MKIAKRSSYLLLSLLLIHFTACQGGPLCGAISDPQTDPDADCVATSSDNCPLTYNPSQVDLDSDSLGVACDENDADETCGIVTATSDGDCGTPASISAPTFMLAETLLQKSDQSDYIAPEESAFTITAPFDLEDSACRYVVVDCDGEFLGDLNLNRRVDFAITSPAQELGAATGACSAFDPQATLPPILYCNDRGSYFVGYITINQNINHHIDTCEVIASLGLNDADCR